MRRRTFVIIGVLVTLLVAGLASFYASTSPDGLEYVARKTGFADTAQESATEDSPLSGYEVRGVENDALSGGLAGVIGALVVLVVAGGLAYAVRRRGRLDPEGPEAQGDPRARDAEALDRQRRGG